MLNNGLMGEREGVLARASLFAHSMYSVGFLDYQ